MPKPYDASCKAVIEASPEAWLRLAGYEPRCPVEIINVDLSAVTSAADFALKVHDPEGGWVVHVEFISGRQRGLNPDLVLRNALLHHREGCAVRTIVYLLQPDASRPEISGMYETWIRGKRQLALEYDVVKVYERSAEELLSGAPGLAPAAVLAKDVRRREDVPGVLERLHDRLTETLGEDIQTIKELWTVAELYLGLKFKGEESKAWIKSLTRGVLSVKDSVIYQDIYGEGEAAGLDKGRKEGRKEGRDEGRVETQLWTILMMGGNRWGQPNEGEKVALEAITDVERLSRMFKRMVENASELQSWDDLLQVR